MRPVSTAVLGRNRRDASCHEPPALLHANGQLKKVVRALHARGPKPPGLQIEPRGVRLSRASISAMLHEHLHADTGAMLEGSRTRQRAHLTPAQLCVRASNAVPGLDGRLCNLTFLLRRLESQGGRYNGNVFY